MNLSSRKHDKIVIIDLSGRIDCDYDRLKEQILALVKDEIKVIMNCSGLEYITSFGLRAFLNVLKKMTHSESSLIICCLQKNVKNIFAITGFLNLFEIYNTEQEAIEHVLESE